MPTTGELTVQVNNIERRVTNHEHDLYGNGDKGLKSRMQSAEMWIADQERNQTRREENLQRALYTLVGTLVTCFVIWAATTLWDTSEKKAAAAKLENAAVRLEAAAESGR